MTDTSPEVRKRIRQLTMARSGAERLAMGNQLYLAARTMVSASLARDARYTDDTRVGLFLRFYGRDFDPKVRDEIVAHLRSVASRASRR